MSAARHRPAGDHSQELEELAAGFAVGALDEPDVPRFQAHAAVCERCAWLVREYRGVARALPRALEPIDASPGLRDRIMAAAHADVSGDGQTVGSEPPAVLHESPPHVSARRRPYIAWALPLAALALVTIGLGYWNFALQRELAAQTAALETHRQALQAIAMGAPQWTLAGTDEAPRAVGLVVQSPDTELPFVLLFDLPELPPDRAYQAWVIAGNTPRPAGLLPPGRGGSQIAQLEQPLTGAQTVAFTIEPRGGSPAPTGPIVVAGSV